MFEFLYLIFDKLFNSTLNYSNSLKNENKRINAIKNDDYYYIDNTGKSRSVITNNLVINTIDKSGYPSIIDYETKKIVSCPLLDEAKFIKKATQCLLLNGKIEKNERKNTYNCISKLPDVDRFSCEGLKYGERVFYDAYTDRNIYFYSIDGKYYIRDCQSGKIIRPVKINEYEEKRNFIIEFNNKIDAFERAYPNEMHIIDTAYDRVHFENKYVNLKGIKYGGGTFRNDLYACLIDGSFSDKIKAYKKLFDKEIYDD